MKRERNRMNKLLNNSHINNNHSYNRCFQNSNHNNCMGINCYCNNNSFSHIDEYYRNFYSQRMNQVNIEETKRSRESSNMTTRALKALLITSILNKVIQNIIKIS